MLEKYYKIKNINTGIIFTLPKERVDFLVKNEPHDFKVVDKTYKEPKVAVEEPFIATISDDKIEQKQMKK